ncbi:hypothetical protein TNCV_2939131 [Trichonephila clavipes]|nr:hypothetical protein TNCV_2939131 [Trichonephila clavipes]
MDSCLACHEFKPRSAEGPRCRRGRCKQNLSMLRSPLSGVVWKTCALTAHSKTLRAVDDEPPGFEPWSNSEDDTRAGSSSPNYPTTPTGGFRAMTNLTCISPTSQVFRGTKGGTHEHGH